MNKVGFIGSLQQGRHPTWEHTKENGGPLSKRALGKEIVTGLELVLGDVEAGLRKYSLVLVPSGSGASSMIRYLTSFYLGSRRNRRG